MGAVTLILDGKEIKVPKADAEWFIKEKGAKEVGRKAAPKKESSKTTQKAK